MLLVAVNNTGVDILIVIAAVQILGLSETAFQNKPLRNATGCCGYSYTKHLIIKTGAPARCGHNGG